jgi:hypothetical protein
MLTDKRESNGEAKRGRLPMQRCVVSSGTADRSRSDAFYDGWNEWVMRRCGSRADIPKAIREFLDVCPEPVGGVVQVHFKDTDGKEYVLIAQVSLQFRLEHWEGARSVAALECGEAEIKRLLKWHGAEGGTEQTT